MVKLKFPCPTIIASDIPFMAGYAVVPGPLTNVYDSDVRWTCRVNNLQALVAFIAAGHNSTRTRQEIIAFGERIGARSFGNANSLSYLNPSYGYLRRKPGTSCFVRNTRPKLFVRIERGRYGLTETGMNMFERMADTNPFSQFLQLRFFLRLNQKREPSDGFPCAV